jgi:hypothetical protein
MASGYPATGSASAGAPDLWSAGPEGIKRVKALVAQLDGPSGGQGDSSGVITGGVTGNGTDAVLGTHMGGANLVTADGITFTGAAGVVADNPVSVGPTGGITSWQHHDHTVYRTGYGFNYGMFYGGV